MKTAYCKRCENRGPVGVNTMRWRNETVQIVECQVCGAAVNTTGWVRIKSEGDDGGGRLTNRFLVFILESPRFRFFINSVMRFFGIFLYPVEEEAEMGMEEEFVDSVVAQVSSYTGEVWDGVENPVSFIDRTMREHRADIQG